jgi:hypothetical protein
VQVDAAYAHLVLQAAVARAGARLAARGVTSVYPFGSPNPGAAASTAAEVDGSADGNGSSGSAEPAFSLPPFLAVTVPGQAGGDGTDRGVYWREPGQSAAASDVVVSVAPVWRRGTPNAAKVSFQQRVALVPTAPGWISAPSHLLLANGGKEFRAHIDPRCIPAAVASSSESGGGGSKKHGRAHRSATGSDAHNSAVGVHFAEVAGFELLPAEVEDAVAGEHSDLLALLEGRPRAPLAAALAAAAGGGPSPTAAAAAAGIGRVSVALGPVLRVPVTVVLPEAPVTGPSGCVYTLTHEQPPAAPTAAAAAASGVSGGGDFAAEEVIEVVTAASGSGGNVPQALASTVAAVEAAASQRSAGGSKTMLQLRPGSLHRRFVAVPQGATWAELMVKRVDAGVGAGATGGAFAPPAVSAAASTAPASAPPPATPARALPARDSESGSSATDGGYESEGDVSGVDAAALTAASPLPGHHRPSHPASAASATPPKPLPPHVARPPVPAAAAAPAVAPSSSTGAAAVDTSARTVVVHCLQLGRHAPPKARELSHERYMGLRPGDEDAITFPVLPGVTLEVVVGQFWSSLGACAVEASLSFRGVALDCGGELHVSAGGGVAAFTATPLLHDVTLRPVGRLTRHVTYVEPAAPALIAPLGERDELITGSSGSSTAVATGTRQYALSVTYKVTAHEGAKGVRLSLPRVHGVLYESPWDGCLVSVVNEDGRVIGTSEAFPEALALPKGEVTVRVTLRHGDVGRLEALRAAPGALLLAVDTPLDAKKAVKLAVTGTHADAATGGGGGGLGGRRAKVGVPTPLFLAAPPASGLPKHLKAGDELSGFLLLEDYAPPGLASSSRVKGSGSGDDVPVVGRAPSGVTVVYHHHAQANAGAPPAPALSAAPSAAAPAAAPSLQQRLADTVRDAAIAMMKTLDPFAPVPAPAAAAVAAVGTPEGGAADVVSSGGSADGGSPGLRRLHASTAALGTEGEAAAASSPAPAEGGPAPPAAAAIGGGGNEFDRLYAWLTGQYPGHLPLLTARLHALDDALAGKGALWAPPSAATVVVGSSADAAAAAVTLRWAPQLTAVAAAARDVTDAIDATSVAAHFGVRHDDAGVPGSDAARAHADFTSKKAALVDAAWRGARAACTATLALVQAGAGATPAALAAAADAAPDFDRSLAALTKWAALADEPRYGLLAVERALRRSQWAGALEALGKLSAGPRPELRRALGSPQAAAAARAGLLALLGPGWAPLARRGGEHALAALWPGRAAE